MPLTWLSLICRSELFYAWRFSRFFCIILRLSRLMNVSFPSFTRSSIFGNPRLGLYPLLEVIISHSLAFFYRRHAHIPCSTLLCLLAHYCSRDVSRLHRWCPALLYGATIWRHIWTSSMCLYHTHRPHLIRRYSTACRHCTALSNFATTGSFVISSVHRRPCTISSNLRDLDIASTHYGKTKEHSSKHIEGWHVWWNRSTWLHILRPEAALSQIFVHSITSIKGAWMVRSKSPASDTVIFTAFRPRRSFDDPRKLIHSCTSSTTMTSV